MDDKRQDGTALDKVAQTESHELVINEVVSRWVAITRDLDKKWQCLGKWGVLGCANVF
jgi:hypothetical protein